MALFVDFNVVVLLFFFCILLFFSLLLYSISSADAKQLPVSKFGVCLFGFFFLPSVACVRFRCKMFARYKVLSLQIMAIAY